MQNVNALTVGLKALAGVATVLVASIPRMSERWDSLDLIVFTATSAALLAAWPSRWAGVLGLVLVMVVSWVAQPLVMPPVLLGWPYGGVPLATAAIGYGLALSLKASAFAQAR